MRELRFCDEWPYAVYGCAFFPCQRDAPSIAVRPTPPGRQACFRRAALCRSAPSGWQPRVTTPRPTPNETPCKFRRSPRCLRWQAQGRTFPGEVRASGVGPRGLRRRCPNLLARSSTKKRFPPPPRRSRVGLAALRQAPPPRLPQRRLPQRFSMRRLRAFGPGRTCTKRAEATPTNPRETVSGPRRDCMRRQREKTRGRQSDRRPQANPLTTSACRRWVPSLGGTR